MLKKSKKINSSFDSEILEKASIIADRYHIIISPKDGMYLGRGREMPLVFGEGKSIDECETDTKEALTNAVAYLLEQGIKAPRRSRTKVVSLPIKKGPCSKKYQGQVNTGALVIS